MNNAKNVLNYAADQGAKFVSVRFTDLPGAWHHLTYPIDQFTEESFEEGFGFDASSVYAAGRRLTNPICCSCRTRKDFGLIRLPRKRRSALSPMSLIRSPKKVTV